MYKIASIVQRLAWIIGRPLFAFFFHFRVTGQENLKGLKNGIIFAANHSSEWDGLLMSGSFSLFSRRLPLYFVAREDKFYKEGLSGSFFYKPFVLRCFGVYPAVFGIKDYERSLTTHIGLLKSGKNIGIFPEGGTTKDGNLRVGKGGVVALSKFANVPIVPVAIIGTFGLTLRGFLLRKYFVTIRFGKPIYPSELFTGYENAPSEEYKKISTEKVIGTIGKMIEEDKMNEKN